MCAISVHYVCAEFVLCCQRTQAKSSSRGSVVAYKCGSVVAYKCDLVVAHNYGSVVAY